MLGDRMETLKQNLKTLGLIVLMLFIGIGILSVVSGFFWVIWSYTHPAIACAVIGLIGIGLFLISRFRLPF
jgi:uncharacterized membrane protein YdfJ with MMPL/SSD domain